MWSLGLGIDLGRTSGLSPKGGIAAPHITFSPSAIDDSASIGDSVGTASISGTYTGTAAWSLSDDDSGKYAIDGSTGAVTVADTLTAGTDSITISVSGVTPAVADRTFSIPVSHAVVGSYVPTYHFLGF